LPGELLSRLEALGAAGRKLGLDKHPEEGFPDERWAVARPIPPFADRVLIGSGYGGSRPEVNICMYVHMRMDVAAFLAVRFAHQLHHDPLGQRMAESARLP